MKFVLVLQALVVMSSISALANPALSGYKTASENGDATIYITAPYVRAPLDEKQFINAPIDSTSNYAATCKRLGFKPMTFVNKDGEESPFERVDREMTSRGNLNSAVIDKNGMFAGSGDIKIARPYPYGVDRNTTYPYSYSTKITAIVCDNSDKAYRFVDPNVKIADDRDGGYTVYYPTLGGLSISIGSNADGVCKLFGFTKSLRVSPARSSADVVIGSNGRMTSFAGIRSSAIDSIQCTGVNGDRELKRF